MIGVLSITGGCELCARKAQSVSRNRKSVDKQGGTIGPPNRDVNAANRVILALSLRARKMTYEDIAHQCGYSNASACRKAILRELNRVIVADVEQLRREEADGLDQLEVECWNRLEDKEHTKAMLFAVDRIVAIKERRAKLLGLDTPTSGDVIANQIVVRGMPVDYLGGQAE